MAGDGGGEQLELLTPDEVGSCDVYGAAVIRRALHVLAVQGRSPVEGSWAGGYAATPLLAAALAERYVTLVIVRQTRRTTNEGRRTGWAWAVVRAWEGDAGEAAAALRTWPRRRGPWPELVPGYGDLEGWALHPGDVAAGIRRDAVAWLRWALTFIDAADDGDVRPAASA